MNVSEEFQITIAGVDMAGKRWRNGERRVIALHGWLDNAASFDVLAPLLNADVIALDLAGHGHSYHRPPQATYNIWDDLPDIVRIADQLQWDRFHVIGHSRGAIIATLLATALPERVYSSVLLDGLRADAVPPEDFSQQLRRYLQEHLRPPRVSAKYKSIEEAVEVRCRATGMRDTSALPIVKRALRQIDDKWHWRNDSRVRFASAVKMTQAHIDAVIAQFVQQRHYVLLAENGLRPMFDNNGELQRWPRLKIETVLGNHHFHMEESAQLLADKINIFWE